MTDQTYLLNGGPCGAMKVSVRSELCYVDYRIDDEIYKFQSVHADGKLFKVLLHNSIHMYDFIERLTSLSMTRKASVSDVLVSAYGAVEVAE